MMLSLRQSWIVVLVLWCGVLASAVAAIYTRHRARELFVDLQQLHAERDNLEITFGQLQIEQSAISAHAFIERVAVRRLNMTMPEPAAIQVVHP